MGSPSAELNVPESLRPWYQNGLQFLFKESVPGLEELEKAPFRRGRAGAENARPAVSSAPPRKQPVVPDARSTKPMQNPGSTGQQGFQQPTPAARPSRIPERKPPVQKQPDFPAPDSWPSPWSTMASRISPRLQIFWTYAQLGQDLSGQADAQRRMLFQSLIGYMGLPKGAISFWPCTSWNGSEFENRADIFWQGVKSYGVKFVACFGDEARSIVAPDVASSAASAHINDVQLVMLQDPDFLKTLPAEEQQLLCISLLRLPLF